MQVVFVDMVSYSRRKSHVQVKVINAFTETIEKALLHMARQYIETQEDDIQIRRDVVLLPAGDGAGIAFPFDDSRDMHITFASELLRLVGEANKAIHCEKFREHGWCDCHNGFLLRCGISQGNLILYKDLNDNYNIAGDTVNMAARVMDLADANQIFLTHAVHNHLVDLGFREESDFRLYSQVKIKHDVLLDVYQYIDQTWPRRP
jgi:class 3 adenylate cyclase